jgi:hypothetical protein
VHFSVKVINDKLTSVIIPENFHEELSSWLKTVFGLTELTDLKLETDKDAILLNALNDELYFESKQVGNKLRKDLGVLAPILLDYKYTVAQRKMVVAAINQKKSTHENILEHSLPQLEYAKDIYRQQLKKKIENGQLILPAWWDFAIMGSGYIELKPHLLKNKSSNKIPHQLIDFLTTEKIRTVHISSFQNMDTGFIFLEGPAYNTQNYDLYGDKWLNQAKILLNMVFKVNFSDLEIYKSYMYELAFSSEQLGKYINRQLGPLKSLFYSKDKNDQAFKIDLKALII